MTADRAAWAYALTTVLEPIRANKYHARRCTVDGIGFDSRKEARRYEELRMLERAGAITSLELQPAFVIRVVELWRDDGQRIVCGRFRADFRYVDLATGEVVIEDAKSPATKTTAYRLRKRLVEAIHGVTIREV